MRLNGFLRNTEDIDLLLPISAEIDILFAANGETYESLQPHVVTTEIEGVPIVTLDIEGLLKTKTTFREKDQIDREALTRLLGRLKGGGD